jgi:hypothetical protein
MLKNDLLLDQLDPKITELTAAVEQEANKQPAVVRLMTHPGVGPITGLAYVLVIGTPDRFPCIPSEDSSAGHQRLGHISKQGNALLRYLLGEAAQAAARCNPDWRRRYVHLTMRREKSIAKVAMARKLAVRLYWMWRNIFHSFKPFLNSFRFFVSTLLHSLLRVVFLIFSDPLHRRPRLVRNLSVSFSPTQTSLRSKLRP